jgi:hypothetical protein
MPPEDNRQCTALPADRKVKKRRPKRSGEEPVIFEVTETSGLEERGRGPPFENYEARWWRETPLVASETTYCIIRGAINNWSWRKKKFLETLATAYQKGFLELRRTRRVLHLRVRSETD